MFQRFVPQNDQLISRLDSEHFSGLFGKYDLSALAHADCAEYVLAFRRNIQTGLFLVMMDQIVKFDVI